MGKICSSISRVPLNEDLEEVEFFERTLALTFLALPSEPIFNILVKYLEFLYQKATFKSAIRQTLEINNLTFLKCSFLALHLGWEALSGTHSSNLPEFFIFFNSPGGGGFKFDMPSADKKKGQFTQPGQPSSSVVNRKANKSNAGNIAGRNKSADTPISGAIKQEVKKEVKKEIKKDFNLETVKDGKGKTRMIYTVRPCSRHYLAARLDPFGTIGGACMPSANFNFPSLKTKVVAAGSMRLGTSGIGFVAYLPAWGSDSANITYTGSTSVGTGSTAFSAFTNLSTLSFPQLPYAAASFGSDLQGRFVAGGIRISYSGSLMNRNGTAFCYCDPDHSSVTNTGTLNSIGNIETTRRINITNAPGDKDGWLCQVLDNGPVIEDEIQFKAGSAVQSTPYMILVVNGTAGDLYEFEVVQHCELQGRIVPGMTESHVDETTWPPIDNTIKEAFNHGPPQVEENPGILKAITGAIADQLPRITNLVSGSVPTIVKGIMGLIPMGGGNMWSGMDGFSKPGVPMLMHSPTEKARLDEGLGRGSNLLKNPKDLFFEDLYNLMKMRNISPQILLDLISPDPDDCGAGIEFPVLVKGEREDENNAEKERSGRHKAITSHDRDVTTRTRRTLDSAPAPRGFPFQLP